MKRNSILLILWLALAGFLGGVIVGARLDRPVLAQTGGYGFTTYADITGTGSNIQVDSTAGHSCRWIQIVTPSTNSTTLVRWGDVNISGTQGGTIAAGGGQFLQPLPPLGATSESRYDITKLYVRAASMDKVSVVCGQ